MYSFYFVNVVLLNTMLKQKGVLLLYAQIQNLIGLKLPSPENPGSNTASTSGGGGRGVRVLQGTVTALFYTKFMSICFKLSI
jgi:hypothetical protein